MARQLTHRQVERRPVPFDPILSSDALTLAFAPLVDSAVVASFVVPYLTFNYYLTFNL